MRFHVAFLLICHVSLAQMLEVPQRSGLSPTGSQLVSLLAPLSLAAREDRIFQEIMSGNVPAFLRTLVKVTYAQGGKSISVWTTPDYLSLGSDDDYFLIPMTPILAQRIANELDCSMPTKLLVDRIYSAASLKLRPQPIPWSAEMVTIPVFSQHNDSVHALRDPHLPTHPVGTLVGGHKKDVIISHKIYSELKTNVPSPVVIYGWHQLNGIPIQPVYNGHVDWYADYSHGIRLVSDSMQVDGEWMLYRTLVADGALYTLVADAGPITKPYYASPTGVGDDGGGQPEGFQLYQNYPNPFNPATNIEWRMKQAGWVKVSVIDLRGREVAVLLDGEVSAGSHTAVWDASWAASGVYVYKLSLLGPHGIGTSLARHMLLVR